MAPEPYPLLDNQVDALLDSRFMIPVIELVLNLSYRIRCCDCAHSYRDPFASTSQKRILKEWQVWASQEDRRPLRTCLVACPSLGTKTAHDRNVTLSPRGQYLSTFYKFFKLCRDEPHAGIADQRSSLWVQPSRHYSQTLAEYGQGVQSGGPSIMAWLELHKS